MTHTRSLRMAIPAALVALALASTPAMALQPSVLVLTHPDSQTGNITDMAARGAAVAVTTDILVGGERQVGLMASTDAGATWPILDWATTGPTVHVESAAAVCAGRAVAVYAEVHPAFAPTARVIRSASHQLGSAIKGQRTWTTSGTARRPDAACVANTELAVAWFETISGGHKVVLETGVVTGDDLSPQRFSIGAGSPGRGLSVAATSDRVYVAWFTGSTLKLRRYRIGTSSTRTLTALGTTTLGTIQGGTTPRIGADGSKVVIAYTQGADLRVRRSTNRGVSFGSARTVRDLPDASEVGALATTVAVKGNLVALGVIDVGGIETLTGTGRGYKSTDGGSTFRRVTTHTGGRVLAAVVKVGSSYRWAELWDRSLSQPSPGPIRFRRE